MATKAQIAAAANRHREEEGGGMPVLSASSPKKTLLKWLAYLDDSEMPDDMTVDDAWATIKGNVAQYLPKNGPKLTLGRVV